MTTDTSAKRPDDDRDESREHAADPATAPATPASVEASASPAGPSETVTPAHDTDAAVATAPDPTPPPQPNVVYVQAPQPPKKRGARGVGALVALLGAGIFALAYAVLVLLVAIIGSPAGFAPAFQFLSSVTYFVPVIVFFLAYLLLIIVVNRAGWWAHVLGGFVVALITWVGFVGAAIIAAGAFGGTGTEVGSVVLQQLTNPLGFAAAIAAREVPIWVGGLVSKRGRTARDRNAANRAAYEQELAEHRTTIGGNTAV